MASIKRIIKKTKRKFEEFKKDEHGEGTINQILMLVLALIIILGLLTFALWQLDNIKEGVEDLFNIDFDGGENESNSIKTFFITSKKATDNEVFNLQGISKIFHIFRFPGVSSLLTLFC